MNPKEAARQEARALIKKHGIKSPPVNVERIARSLGVKVEFAPFDDELSGMAFIKDGVPAIGINSLHHPNRQRFTLAHELAHIVLHPDQLEKAVHVDKGSLRRDRVSGEGTDLLEIQANIFPQVLETLANKFRVSLTALQHRLHI
jgi:Zn-dependent peptidase ImmA (M78 family)